MPILIDSNILLDVITTDSEWVEWSSSKMMECGDSDFLVINPLILAEISVSYDSIEELDLAVERAMLIREALPWEAAFLAGRCFLEYRKRGGTRRSPLPDFYIGAHASISGYALLTRDAARYQTYFPKLKLIAPE